MIGKLAGSFCAVFSVVYGENGLGGDCGAGAVFAAAFSVAACTAITKVRTSFRSTWCGIVWSTRYWY